MPHQTALSAEVNISRDIVEAHVRDERAGVLAVFAPLNNSQRVGLVTDAWTVGLRALMNAYKQAEESRLQDISKSLTEDLDHQLAAYLERQQTTFAQVLARYFDPH